jgi:hypothetical protein
MPGNGQRLPARHRSTPRSPNRRLLEERALLSGSYARATAAPIAVRARASLRDQAARAPVCDERRIDAPATKARLVAILRPRGSAEIVRCCPYRRRHTNGRIVSLSTHFGDRDGAAYVVTTEAVRVDAADPDRLR